MNHHIPLFVSLDAVKNDPALQNGSRGARKIGVTSLYQGKEIPFESTVWNGKNEGSPVISFDDTEYAVFTEVTVQDRHYHKEGVEFYTVLSGEFHIEVMSEIFTLSVGDTIVVPAGVVHEVHRSTKFIAQVITVHCGGVADKYIV